MASPVLDVINIGRSSVDLDGAQVGGRLEDMGSFRSYVGGSPTNIAYGAERLELRSAVIMRVGDEAGGVHGLTVPRGTRCRPKGSGTTLPDTDTRGCCGNKPGRRGRRARLAPSSVASDDHEHPVVAPQVSHFRHVPLRTMVKLAHSGQASPT